MLQRRDQDGRKCPARPDRGTSFMAARVHPLTVIRSVTRILAVASAVALAGCGSSGATAAPSPTAALPAPSPTTAATGTPRASVADRSQPATTGAPSLKPFVV